jgi:hypothetical protein
MRSSWTVDDKKLRRGGDSESTLHRKPYLFQFDGLRNTQDTKHSQTKFSDILDHDLPSSLLPSLRVTALFTAFWADTVEAAAELLPG